VYSEHKDTFAIKSVHRLANDLGGELVAVAPQARCQVSVSAHGLL